MAHHFFQSSNDAPKRAGSLMLGRARPACGSAWGLVEGGRGAQPDVAALPAPKRALPLRADSADFSSFSMSGFG